MEESARTIDDDTRLAAVLDSRVQVLNRAGRPDELVMTSGLVATSDGWEMLPTATTSAEESGHRILSSPNRGRKSSKVLQDHTICVSSRCTGLGWTMSQKRKDRYRMAGLWDEV